MLCVLYAWRSPCMAKRCIDEIIACVDRPKKTLLYFLQWCNTRLCLFLLIAAHTCNHLWCSWSGFPGFSNLTDIISITAFIACISAEKWFEKSSLSPKAYQLQHKCDEYIDCIHYLSETTDATLACVKSSMYVAALCTVLGLRSSSVCARACVPGAVGVHNWALYSTDAHLVSVILLTIGFTYVVSNPITEVTTPLNTSWCSNYSKVNCTVTFNVKLGAYVCLCVDILTLFFTLHVLWLALGSNAIWHMRNAHSRLQPQSSKVLTVVPYILDANQS